jgi:hypothetical protein
LHGHIAAGARDHVEVGPDRHDIQISAALLRWPSEQRAPTESQNEGTREQESMLLHSAFCILH